MAEIQNFLRNWKEMRRPAATSMMMAIKNVGRFVMQMNATVICQLTCHPMVDQTLKH